MVEKIDIKNVKQVVCDRLEIEINNISLCAKMGNNTIKVFPSFIHKALNGEDFYAFVPKESIRYDKGDWAYDISSFKIYKFKAEDFLYLGITKEVINTLNSSSMISLPLSESYLIYNSNEGIIMESSSSRSEFTLREKACLYLRLPESGTKWLDDLIEKKQQMYY